jgi:hypothetical protein
MDFIIGLGMIFIVITLINIDHNIVVGLNSIEEAIKNKKYEI